MVETQVHAPDNPQYSELREFIRENRDTPGPLIQVLHRAQEIFGYLPQEVQSFVARELNVSYAEVYGVVTFYNFFRTEPIGEHIISICLGTACHVKGAQKIADALSDELGIQVGETTRDRFYTLSTARCFGACGLAPAMMIDSEVFGKLTEEKARKVVLDFKKDEQK